MSDPITTVCRKAAIGLGWIHPFFAVACAKVRFREVKDESIVNTMAMSPDGTIWIYEPFARKLTTEELRFVLAHELMHMLALHYFRQGTRKKDPWNCACDAAINPALVDSGLQAPTTALLPPDEWRGWHAERIYDEMKANAKAMEAASGGGDTKHARPGEGCGVREDLGDMVTAAAEREWKQVQQQAIEMAKQQGQGKGNALFDALDVPKPRVRWTAIVRRGLAEARAMHGRDDQTWMKRGRRSKARGPQFPGWVTSGAKCAVIIDTSGSISDDDLQQDIAETCAISKASPVKVFLVTHDDGIQWQGWLSPGVKPHAVSKAMTGRGGTNAHEAYAAVGDAAKRFDVMVHLTDGWLDWPVWPENCRRKIVALTGYDYDTGRIPPGARVIEVQSQ